MFPKLLIFNIFIQRMLSLSLCNTTWEIQDTMGKNSTRLVEENLVQYFLISRVTFFYLNCFLHCLWIQILPITKTSAEFDQASFKRELGTVLKAQNDCCFLYSNFLNKEFLPSGFFFVFPFRCVILKVLKRCQPVPLFMFFPLDFSRGPVIWFENEMLPAGSCVECLVPSWSWHFGRWWRL
jgi:hypothetical protein